MRGRRLSEPLMTVYRVDASVRPGGADLGMCVVVNTLMQGSAKWKWGYLLQHAAGLLVLFWLIVKGVQLTPFCLSFSWPLPLLAVALIR